MFRVVDVHWKTVNVFRLGSRAPSVTLILLSCDDFLLPTRIASSTLSIRFLSPCRLMLTVPSGMLRAYPARLYMIACFWIIARKPTFWIIAPLTMPLMACCSALAAPAVKTAAPHTTLPTSSGAKRPTAKFMCPLRPFEHDRPTLTAPPIYRFLAQRVPCPNVARFSGSQRLQRYAEERAYEGER